MFVFLSKLLPLFVYPVGLASLLILAGLVLWRRPVGRWLVGLALAGLWIAGTPWLPSALARSLEWRYLPPETVPTAEALVLLGGGTDAPDYPRPTVEVNGAGDRVLYAARLYQAGAAPRILLSGGRIDWMDAGSSTPATEMADLLALTGVPAEALWLQPASRNTAEDAQFSTAILEEHGVRRILLVTSAMHMPRSVALFEKQGLEVIPLPTDYNMTQQRWDSLFHPTLETFLISLLPSESNLRLVTVSLKEYIGMAVYRLQGWL